MLVLDKKYTLFKYIHSSIITRFMIIRDPEFVTESNIFTPRMHIKELKLLHSLNPNKFCNLIEKGLCRNLIICKSRAVTKYILKRIRDKQIIQKEITWFKKIDYKFAKPFLNWTQEQIDEYGKLLRKYNHNK